MRAIFIAPVLILSINTPVVFADDVVGSSAWVGPYVGAFIGSSFGEDRELKTNAEAYDYKLSGDNGGDGGDVNGGYCLNKQSGNIIAGLTGPDECLNSNPNAVWVSTGGVGGDEPDGESEVVFTDLLVSQLTGNSSDSGRTLGGVKVGYNWQKDRLVYGVEADISSVRDKTLRSSASAEADIDGQTPGMIKIDADAKLGVDWFSTLRGRLGYAVSDNLLPFVTAGLAYGKVRNKVSYKITDDDYLGGAEEQQGSLGGNSSETGWTVGAGADYRLSSNILANITYLYVDLGSKDKEEYTYVNSTNSRTAFVGSEVDPSFHVLRVGLSWQF